MGDPPSSAPAMGEPPTSEATTIDVASAEPAPVESCGATRYTVQCSMPKDHDGAHQHVPPNDGVILSWKPEPPDS